MYLTDDPAADFHRHDRQQQKQLARLPRCSICGEPIIQDSAVKLNGEWLCDECLSDNRQWIEVD